MEQEKTEAVRADDSGQTFGTKSKNLATAGVSTNDGIVAQDQASPLTMKSFSQRSHSRPRSNFKPEDEQHKRTLVFVDHLDNSIRNSAFVLPSVDCLRSQSFKMNDSDSLIERARLFCDVNEQQNMPRALSTFCQRIRIPEVTAEPQVVRAGWLVQHLFWSVEEDGQSFTPNTFCYGIKGVKQVDPATQRTQLHQRARALNEQLILQFEWGSDSKKVHVYKENLGQTELLRCLVADAKQLFAFNIFVDTRESDYLRHFQKTVDFLDVIAIACYIYHHAVDFVAARNVQDLRSADKAREQFQNITKHVTLLSQDNEAAYEELFKDQPISLYRTLNDEGETNTCQEKSEATFQQKQEVASEFQGPNVVISPLTGAQTEPQVETKPKSQSALKKQAARKRRKEKARAAKQALGTTTPEIGKEQSTPLTAEQVKAEERVTDEEAETENALPASTSGAQLAVVSASPIQRSIERLSREATRNRTVFAEVAHEIASRFARSSSCPAPFLVPLSSMFSYSVPHHGTRCWWECCLKPTLCWNGQTVICPRCGPKSWVRYCCIEHLFFDATNHYIYHCGRRPNPLVINEASLPPAAGPQGVQRPYTLAALETFESHRQALHRSMSRLVNVDYYIFNDLDNVWRATGGNRQPPKEVLMGFRGTGRAVWTVALPVGQKKQQLNAALDLALSQGRAAAPGVMPRERLNFVFLAIKESLELSLLWNEDMCDRVCLQMQLEFGFVVSPELY